MRYGVLVSFMVLMVISVRAADPVLYIVGDSTVETRNLDKPEKQQGWGGHIDRYFHSGRLTIENHAIGGRSSRSFRNEGRWQQVLDLLQPGDFVMIQFGHNDGGGLDKNKDKASLKGMGDETEEIEKDDGSTEAVHSYGWYMKAYIREAQAKGATVIICSPVPRCIFGDDGRIGRSDEGYDSWAKKAAKEEGAWFIDLHEIVAKVYDDTGDEEEVRKEYFADHHTHTNRKGAELNAECVIAGLRGQRNCPLYKYLNSKGLKVSPYRD